MTPAPFTAEALVESLSESLAARLPILKWQADASALALVSGPLVPLITEAAQFRDQRDAAEASLQRVTAERDEARAIIEGLARDLAKERTATAEAARLRGDAEAKDRALKEKAEEQVAYWRERQRAEKCLEDGVSEDGQTYTPIGDEAAWQAGYCNGRMSEADWWAKTFLYWPNEAARAATEKGQADG